MDRCIRTILTALLTLLAFTFLLAKSADAYPAPVDFDGSLLRWNIQPDSDPITYEIKADIEDDVAIFGPAIDDAAALWTDVPSSYFAFQPHNGDSGDAAAHVTINLRSTLAGSSYSAGYAIFDEYDDSGPRHCSIYVVIDASVTYVSFAKTILHELGHCIGLGHTLIPQAIMSYSLDENSFQLDIDDQAAVTRLYPADGSAPKLPPGCAILGSTTQSLNSLLTLMLWLLAPTGISILHCLSMRSGECYAGNSGH